MPQKPLISDRQIRQLRKKHGPLADQVFSAIQAEHDRELAFYRTGGPGGFEGAEYLDYFGHGFNAVGGRAIITEGYCK